MQLRFETFNVFNHLFSATPVTSLNSASFGKFRARLVTAALSRLHSKIAF